MLEREEPTGPIRACLLVVARALIRAGFVWITASQTHLMDVRFWALLIVFGILGMGNFTFLSTRPWRSDKLIKYHTLFRKYQAHMLKNPAERPKGDPIRWIAMVASAVAASLMWAWVMVLACHFITLALNAEPVTRVALLWMIFAVFDSGSRILRMITQGQIGVFGIPFNEAYQKVSKFEYEDRHSEPF